MDTLLLGAGVVAFVLGVVLLVRPDRTAEYRDVRATGDTPVSGAFGVAVSRLNGVLFVFLGLWLAWTGFT